MFMRSEKDAGNGVSWVMEGWYNQTCSYPVELTVMKGLALSEIM